LTHAVIKMQMSPMVPRVLLSRHPRILQAIPQKRRFVAKQLLIDAYLNIVQS